MPFRPPLLPTCEPDSRFQYQIEVATNKLITHLMCYIFLNPSTAASANTSDRLTLRWIKRTHYIHANGGGNGFTMVVVFIGCELRLA